MLVSIAVKTIHENYTKSEESTTKSAARSAPENCRLKPLAYRSGFLLIIGELCLNHQPRSGCGLQPNVAALRGYVGVEDNLFSGQPRSGCGGLCTEGRNRFAVVIAGG